MRRGHESVRQQSAADTHSNDHHNFAEHCCGRRRGFHAHDQWDQFRRRFDGRLRRGSARRYVHQFHGVDCGHPCFQHRLNRVLPFQYQGRTAVRARGRRPQASQEGKTEPSLQRQGKRQRWGAQLRVLRFVHGRVLVQHAQQQLCGRWRGNRIREHDVFRAHVFTVQ
jgi:hypothetical protein